MLRIFAFALLVLCPLLTGCLVDGVKTRESESQNKPNPSDEGFFHISGRMVVGVMDAAIVRVYPYINGVLSTEAVTESFTNVKGYYQLQIPREYLGGPALISASKPARVKCSLVSGCGSVAFGEWLELDGEEWNLNVAVPNLNENGVYHGTALTHLGFSLFDAEMAKKNNATNAVVSAWIEKSNSKVVSAFGLVGDLPSFNISDIASLSDFESATALEIRYSLMNSAIILAASDVFKESNLYSALKRLSSQFLDKGISGYSSGHNVEVTQILVLEKLVDSFNYLQESMGFDFTAEISEALTLRNLYKNEAAQDYSRGTSSVSAGYTAVERAKKMLTSVREVAFSMDLRKLAQFSNLAAFTSGDVADALEGFGIVVDTAELVGSQKTDRLVTSLATVTEAVLEVLTLYYDRQPVPEAVQGIKIIHTGSARRHSFEIRDFVSVCESDKGFAGCEVPVNLMLTMDVSYFGGNLSSSLVVIDDLRLSLGGYIGSEDHRLIFPGVATTFAARQLFFQKKVDMVEGKFLFEVNQWSLDVPFSITSLSEDLEATMPVVVQASGDKLGITWEDQKSIENETDISVESTVAHVYRLYDLKDFNASANISVNIDPEDQFFAAFHIKQGVRAFEGDAIYKTSHRQLCIRSSGECSKHDEKTEIEGEASENFVQLSASAAYKANLKGVQSPVLIQITGSRESPQNINIRSLKVNYSGHALALNGRFNNNGGITALNAVNLDGTHLYFNSINGKRIGAVETASKEKVADITDMGQWVKVRYINGEFESL
jgi:hypothetical protein